VRPFPGKEEVNVITGVVSDIIFQHDRYKVTIDHGLYIYLSEAPKTGKTLSLKIQVECLK
jgi:hypothetical protein